MTIPYTLEEMNRSSEEKKFSVISTFAGGGGSSIGYKLAGGEVLLANELSPSAAKSYSRNHPKTEMINTNIKTMVEDGVELEDVDILDGSPPCVTFSVARGKKRQFEEETETENLVLNYVELALKIRPKICVIENVQQFQNAPVFEDTIGSLKNGGYKVNQKVLDSVQFGVPQKRKRLFIIGVREDIAARVGIDSHDDILGLYPTEQTSEEITVRDALDGIVPPPEERDYLLSHMRRSSSYEILKAIPKNPPRKTRMSMLDDEWQSDFQLDRASWSKPCPTITAVGAQTNRGGICHPDEDRLFTINELGRLMSLPDDYVLSGTWNQKAQAIGNMVPPMMMCAIAKSLYENVIVPSQQRPHTTYVTPKVDLGEKETYQKWNGKFLKETELNQIIKVTEDTIIRRPDSGKPIAFVVTDVFPNDDCRNVLYGIDQHTVMRANCSGPIDRESMLEKGLVEGRDYKLRNPNSYFVRTRSGDWAKIARANEINSVMIGAKRGRFTGRITISNRELWDQLGNLCLHVENAFQRVAPVIYEKQRRFAEKAICPEYRHGIITTLSANRYSSDQTQAMSVHRDGKDVEYTTMSCHRKGDYEGAYLAFPRWSIGIDLPDNSVCIADSKSLHCVTPIRGKGQRFTTVLYTDKSTATIKPLGKPEKPIGRAKRVVKN